MTVSKAHLLFLAEVAHAAEQVRSVLDEDLGLLIQHRDELRRAFHTTKGGAGFLGFRSVAEAAAEIEEVLAIDQPLPSRDELAELLSHFEQAIAALPANPKEGRNG